MLRTADSAAEYTMTINVDAVQDAATGAPTISGIAQVGQTLTALTASPADVADLDGLPGVFEYQWIRVDADGTSNPTNIGADSSTYTLTASDEGKKVKVEVSFRDNGGTSEGPLPSLGKELGREVDSDAHNFMDTLFDQIVASVRPLPEDDR